MAYLAQMIQFRRFDTISQNRQIWHIWHIWHSQSYFLRVLFDYCSTRVRVLFESCSGHLRVGPEQDPNMGRLWGEDKLDNG